MREKVATLGTVAGVALVCTLWSAPALRGLPASADRLAESWRAVNESQVEMSLADKITYALILAEGPKESRRQSAWRSMRHARS
jgi:hypothetical protein